MADVTAIFGSLLFLGMAFPGLLITWWLLLPVTVAKSSVRWECSFWHSLGLGLGEAVLLAIPIAALLAAPAGIAQLLGWVLLVLGLTTATIGTSGLVQVMAPRLRERCGARWSEAGSFLWSAVALELAWVLPVLGWFFVLPVVLLVSLGSSTLALLRPLPLTAGLSAGASAPAAVQA
jgi:hypothetical protein